MGCPKIMFVCTANICRSQLASLRFTEFAQMRKPSVLDDLGLQVSSCGIWATPSEPVCKFVTELQGDLPKPFSKNFNPELVDNQTLILVMEQKHQATLIREYPSLRSQIHQLEAAVQMTLKLANELKENSLFMWSSQEVNDQFTPKQLPNDLLGKWEWILEELNEQRGFLPNPNQLTLAERFDIPDNHGKPEEMHIYTRDLIDQSVGMLVSGIQAILEMTPSQGLSMSDEGK